MNFEDPKYRETFWHTASHCLAQAVVRLYPDVKLAIGPAIEEGFYYDFDSLCGGIGLCPLMEGPELSPAGFDFLDT